MLITVLRDFPSPWKLQVFPVDSLPDLTASLSHVGKYASPTHGSECTYDCSWVPAIRLTHPSCSQPLLLCIPLPGTRAPVPAQPLLPTYGCLLPIDWVDQGTQSTDVRLCYQPQGYSRAAKGKRRVPVKGREQTLLRTKAPEDCGGQEVEGSGECKVNCHEVLRTWSARGTQG